MPTQWWKVLGLLLLMLLAGCAAGETSRGDTSYSSSLFDVPPSFYGNDPAMRQWYTPPYFMPYEMP